MERVIGQNVCHAAIRRGKALAGRNTTSTRCSRGLHLSPLLYAKKPSKPPAKAKPSPTYKQSTRAPPQPLYIPKSPSTITPPPNPFRYRGAPLFLAGFTLFGATLYGTYYFILLSRPSEVPIPTTASAQPDVSSRYNAIAPSFDAEVDWTEWSMGITSLRKKVAAEATGDVLEVSIGTGRNLEYYDWDFGKGKGEKRGKVRSLTAVDMSEEMLEVAHDKFSAMFPGILGVRWVVADASEAGSIPLPPKSANERSGTLNKKYDTIIQTMGLCSVNDPVKLLRNLSELVKEDEGRILLLEHGRAKWNWLNGVLDKFAEGHARAYGCWWNREIEDIVRESGLEVVKIERPGMWHGGTTYWVELRKRSVPGVVEQVGSEVKEKVEGALDVVRKEEGKVEEKVKEKVDAVVEKGSKKGWW